MNPVPPTAIALVLLAALATLPTAEAYSGERPSTCLMFLDGTTVCVHRPVAAATVAPTEPATLLPVMP